MASEISFDSKTKHLILKLLLDCYELSPSEVENLNVIVARVAIGMAMKKFTIPAVFLSENDLLCFIMRKVILQTIVEPLVSEKLASRIEQAAFVRLSFQNYLEWFQSVLLVPHANRADFLKQSAATTLGIGRKARVPVQADGSARASLKRPRAEYRLFLRPQAAR